MMRREMPHLNNGDDERKEDCRATWVHSVAPLAPEHQMRNALVSTMLQDRTVLRLLSAPHGFGKSALAQEYAVRMFSVETVVWVDASAPDFLHMLDDGFAWERKIIPPHASLLVVFDDVPWLHEERAETFSRGIDKMLYQGLEVIVTTLPTCDCLRQRQPERILLQAGDLLVSEQECLDVQRDARAEAKILAQRQWARAQKTMFGRCPSVIWGRSDQEEGMCLRGFFSESLPLQLTRAIVWIILLENGDLRGMRQAGIRVDETDLADLAREYPFLGVSPQTSTFGAKKVPAGMLKEALVANDLSDCMASGSTPLLETLVRLLVRSGNILRAKEILAVFCTQWQRGKLLLDCGWDLLDSADPVLVERLLDECPVELYREFPVLVTMRAWCAGLQGDAREACHFAQAVLRAVEPRGGSAGDGDGDGVSGVRVMAYLALLAFGGAATSVCKKDKFATGEIVTAFDFLASVVDVCEEIELQRAFCLEGEMRQDELARQRIEVDEARERSIAGLFSEYCARFSATVCGRMALHILRFIDNRQLKPLLEDLACDEVVRMRRDGLTRVSEALIVRDLWGIGYFGVGRASVDTRDAQILEQAAFMLEKFAEVSRTYPLDTPWRVDGTTLTSAQIRLRSRAESDFDLMYVRMFGALEVSVGDTVLCDLAWRKKSRLLFSLLVLQQGRDISRETLYEEVWPGMCHTRALDNFYVVWSNICMPFGDAPYLERNGEFCRVNPRYVSSDVADFERLSRRLLVQELSARELLDVYAQIESAYRGNLVPTETKNAFLNAQRERYRSMYVDAMVTGSECALSVHDARVALWFARKAMETEQTREDVYYALIRAQIAAGQRCSAIRTYFKCRNYLQTELGLDPSADTQSLYDTLISTDPSLLKLDPAAFTLL